VSAPPAVSVLMTAFNRERYVADSIESVLAQTFGDFELVVVDDASRDRTVEIAKRYECDPRVRVVVNERNLGDYPNRNRAASLARGELLKYHDSDDVMYEHCLETMAAPLLAEPRAGFALSTGHSWSGGPCPMLLTPRMSYQREFMGTQGLFMCGPASAMFRTEVFRRLGGFPEKGPHSDLVFWLHACARVNVLLVPADLFWYRIHAGQHLMTEAAAYDTALIAPEVWSALTASECPLDPVEREQAKRNWAFVSARGIYRQLRAGQWQLALFGLRHSGLGVADWLRYLRRPRRDPLAGTPLDGHGDYLMPDLSADRVSADLGRQG
jgi:glycosyltransferase involved in cell wall biosynthesis